MCYDKNGSEKPYEDHSLKKEVLRTEKGSQRRHGRSE